MKIELQYFKDIYDEELAKDAIINDRMEGFREDYLTLHCLLKKHKIKSCLEIGCHVGFGTKIICNALGEEGKVISIDLPDDMADISKQHPLSEGKAGVGVECDLPFTLISCDSRYFDYDTYPCEAYWVDGEHTFGHVRHETSHILRQAPKIVIFHDTDEPDVFNAIVQASAGWRSYQLFRVDDTRVSYLLKK